MVEQKIAVGAISVILEACSDYLRNRITLEKFLSVVRIQLNSLEEYDDAGRSYP